LPYQPVPNTTHSNASYSLPAVIVRAAPPRLQDLVGIGGLGPGPGAGLSSGWPAPAPVAAPPAARLPGDDRRWLLVPLLLVATAVSFCFCSRSAVASCPSKAPLVPNQFPLFRLRPVVVYTHTPHTTILVPLELRNHRVRVCAWGQQQK